MGDENDLRSRFSRRKFLVGSIFFGGVSFLFLSGILALRSYYWRLFPKLDNNKPPGGLSDHELDTILSLVKVLVPPHLLLEREEVIRKIHEKTQKKTGRLHEYRIGVLLLDREAKKTRVAQSFARAPVATQEHILRTMFWRYEAGRSEGPTYYLNAVKASLERCLLTEEKRRFRELVVRNFIYVFFTSDKALSLLSGYSHRRGFPAPDVRDYTRPIPLT